MKSVGALLKTAAAKSLEALRGKKKADAHRSQPLPGTDRIYSRNELHDYLTSAMLQLHKENPTLHSTLLLLDLDRFRNINLFMGYSFGDQLLGLVAGRLTRGFTDRVVVQTGDDEFLMLLFAANPLELAERVDQVKNVFAEPFAIAGQECFVNASIGVCDVFLQHDNIGQALRQADLALLSAKHMGKNKTIRYDASQEGPSFNRIHMETELRKAIFSDQLILYYQPRLELSSGNIICLEALVRWKHPIHGIIPPNDFIPLAEESGLILPLGEWVLRRACRQKKEWLDAGIIDYQIAVNISPSQFQQHDFADQIINIIEEAGVAPDCIELEITESSIMHNMENTIAILDKLCKKGVSISIDDFGIGYSSLNYLKHFPIHCLKIDRSFVKNIHSDQSDLAITHAIINLGHSLNLQVVAEGVEMQSQLEILKETKCHTIQGYLLSPPVSAPELELLVSSMRLTLHEEPSAQADIS
ncbi:bifunctional diguanylate cyclase/phosphodiesterase [Paenibacillus athensensis]|nr:bifunctional diguanylate cyclase/phosphodiesterase [Paenibacillus athensensis]MCD1259913.1 bifunctional diguanylate cyclase/phosphodiesterase [Paenibacillus athensensis]